MAGARTGELASTATYRMAHLLKPAPASGCSAHEQRAASGSVTFTPRCQADSTLVGCLAAIRQPMMHSVSDPGELVGYRTARVCQYKWRALVHRC